MPLIVLSYRVTVKSIERVADHASRIASKSMEIQSLIPSLITEKLREIE